MITGEFDEDGSLTVEGELIIPRLGISERVVFLVDTGANMTVVHPQDICEASIPLRLPENMFSLWGIGGSADFYSETASLFFTDDDGITTYPYRLDIGIAAPDANNRDFPSLLGRDILDCWYLECDPTNDILQFTVRRTLWP